MTLAEKHDPMVPHGAVNAINTDYKIGPGGLRLKTPWRDGTW